MSVHTTLDTCRIFQQLALKSINFKNELQKWQKTIYFNVQAGKKCCLKINKGIVDVIVGECENPDMTFKGLDGNILKFITGRDTFTSLEILGNIEYMGDISDRNAFIALVGLFISEIMENF